MSPNPQRTGFETFLVEGVEEGGVCADAGEGGVEAAGGGVPGGEVGGVGFVVELEGGFLDAVRVVAGGFCVDEFVVAFPVGVFFI